MKKLNFLFMTAVIIALATAFISLNSSASSGKKIETPTCCEKKSQGCEGKGSTNGSGELIMESMSRQFISITPF